ncbi:MAG: PAS domain S-box protein, partial [Candidatus Methylomirabilia bacterium]
MKSPVAKKPRILVVDDEMGPRESLRMILKPQYEVTTVDSGEAALEAVPDFHPDLVFMDIKMPTLDGIEVLQQLKARDPSVQVVMITAYASLDTVKSALTYGAFEYLIKPFSRQDLEETARRALDRRWGELGMRGQVSQLVQEMRRLAGKSRELEETARREATEQSLRVTQLSLLREISRVILSQLDLAQMTATITGTLQSGLGYDEVSIHRGDEPPRAADGPTCVVCPIRDGAQLLGYLVADNRPSARAIDPRERELLEMLSEYVTIGIHNSRLYSEIADTKQSLEELIRSAGDAIISVDQADQIAGWNPAAARIFAAPEEEMLGQPITRVLPEADYLRAKALLASDSPAQQFEVRQRRKDGGHAHLAVTLSTLSGKAGELEGLLAIVRDITERKRAEEVATALAQAGRLTSRWLDPKEVAQRIADSLPKLFDAEISGLYKLHPESGYLVTLAVSGGAESTLEANLVLPQGAGLLGLVVRERRPLVTPDVLTDSRVELKPGARIQLEQATNRALLAVPLLLEDRAIGALTVGDRAGRVFTEEEVQLAQVFADQAALALERARLYEEIRDTRDFLQSIAENSADAIVTADVRGRVTYFSPGAEEMFGYQAEEILGQPVAAYYRSGAEEARAVMERLGAEGRIKNYETAFLAKDGRWVEVNTSISLLRDASQAIVGTVGVMKDITERKRVEEELQRQREARVQSEKVAVMGSMLAGVAHELNNPLGLILGHITLFRETAGDAPLVQRMDKIAQAAQRCARIVKNFLALARQHPPERQRVQLNQVV